MTKAQKTQATAHYTQIAQEARELDSLSDLARTLLIASMEATDAAWPQLAADLHHQRIAVEHEIDRRLELTV